MAPKKKTKEQVTDDQDVLTQEQSDQAADIADLNEEDDDSNRITTSAKTGTKRKQALISQESPNKAARHSTDTKPKHPTQHQVLQYLLSPSALTLCRPNDESKALAKLSSDKANSLRTYSSSVLSPFEELLCAVILARPISHALGHRSIRTILTPPYTFTTSSAIRSAGKEKCLEALIDAHTQHKEKTAMEILHVADVVAEEFGDGEEDTSMEKVRRQCGYDMSKERDLLKSSIKGLGPMGLDIFFRRVQWLWPEGFPFMDERTRDAMATLGLPDDPDELLEILNENWEDLDTEKLDGKDGDEKKRRAFVVILERAVGAHLEKKSETILTESGEQ